MLKRGVISKIDGAYAAVFLPDENNAVTAMLPFSKNISTTSVSVGDNCVVAFFDAEYISFADGVIVAVIGLGEGQGTGGSYELTQEDKEQIAEIVLGSLKFTENENQFKALLDGSITEIDSNVKAVRPYACAYAENLLTVNLPETTSIGRDAFNHCVSMTSFNAPNVTSLGSYAFSYCGKLTEVNFPLATSIGSYAFSNCVSMTSFNIPNVTSLGSYAFYGCEKLTEVNFPLATSVPSACFNSCKALIKADFGAAKSIATYSFINCSSLETLILRRSDNVCSLAHAEDCFYNSGVATGKAYIYVPAALVETYKTATNWSVYADRFRAIEDYPDITGG